MAFQLIHEDEPLPPKNLVVVLFGEPGIGKSSLGFTAESPLMLDWDKGLERAVHRKLSVKLNKWSDGMEFMESTVIPDNKIKTLINDTAGTMLDDYLSHHILAMDEKFGNGAGGLGLRGYGVMKDSASKFFVKCQNFGVDVVFICHTAQEKDGDVIKLQPKLTGGAYDILIAKADLIGYMEMKNGKITIDFTPTTRHTGKNCAQLPIMNVPDYTSPEYGNFLAKIISQTKAHIARVNEAQAKAIVLVEEFKTKIIDVKSMEELETLIEGINTLSPMYKAQVNQLYERKFLEYWEPMFMNPEKLNTGADFDALTELIKDLAPGIQLELRSKVKTLLAEKKLTYDKVKKGYIPLADKPADPVKPSQAPSDKPKENVPPGPAEPAPPAKVVHDEEWFVARVGKKVFAKSKAFTGLMDIRDKAQAGHLCHVSQATGGYEFSDPTE